MDLKPIIARVANAECWWLSWSVAELSANFSVEPRIAVVPQQSLRETGCAVNVEADSGRAWRVTLEVGGVAHPFGRVEYIGGELPERAAERIQQCFSHALFAALSSSLDDTSAVARPRRVLTGVSAVAAGFVIFAAVLAVAGLMSGPKEATPPSDVSADLPIGIPAPGVTSDPWGDLRGVRPRGGDIAALGLDSGLAAQRSPGLAP